MNLNRFYKVGQKVTVKPTHVADLRGDPAHGIVIEVLPTSKVRIAWCDGQVFAVEPSAPYMWRFDVR